MNNFFEKHFGERNLKTFFEKKVFEQKRIFKNNYLYYSNRSLLRAVPFKIVGGRDVGVQDPLPPS